MGSARPIVDSQRGQDAGVEKQHLRIALGSDHAGFELKEAIKRHLQNTGHRVMDFGTQSTEPCDYPDYCGPAAACVANGEADLGIVLGGSGNGEAMVANKVHGIRCGVCWDIESAKLTKQHNNANMIAIGARMVSVEEGIEIVNAWLSAAYEGGRHEVRLEKLRGWEGECAG